MTLRCKEMMKSQKLPCQVFVSLFLALVSAAATRHSSVAVHDRCNETLRPSDIKAHDVTVRLRATEAPTGAVSTSPTIYCWTRFEGTGNQFIEITVKELRLGQERSSCSSGFLRISDHQGRDAGWLPPPTTLCGSYNNSLGGKLRVRRRTRSPFALVEFKYDRARKEGGFEYDVTFINKEEESDQLPFGHFHRKEGQLPNTKCDWLIRVNECVGYCNVISPGFPGIYPPNTRCRYLFTNPDNQRVELNFGGKHFSGTFNLRMSENCAEDYVEVYDGRTQAYPLIGRYCGQNGAHIASSGSSILMIFQSGPGQEPPWNYTGFSMLTTERWKYYNDPDEGGNRKPNSSCDLVFHSRNSISGDLHTPDFFLPSETNCTYEFIGSEKYNDRVELTIVTQSDGDRANCTETLVVSDGSTEMKRFCPDRTNAAKFMFNTTSNSATVHYSTTTGQTSNLEPTWIFFKFWRLPKPTPTPMAASISYSTASSAKGSRMSAGRYGLLSDPPAVAQRDHISLDVYAAAAAAAAAVASSAAVTNTLHRTNSVVIEALLLIVPALSYALHVWLCTSRQ